MDFSRCLILFQGFKVLEKVKLLWLNKARLNNLSEKKTGKNLLVMACKYIIVVILPLNPFLFFLSVLFSIPFPGGIFMDILVAFSYDTINNCKGG